MKYIWRAYYFFVKPITKTDIAIAYARKNNKPYRKLSIARDEDEL